jgi:YD repeat-containing protein
MRSRALLALLLGAAALNATGEQHRNQVRGFNTGNAYDINGFDSVNAFNGNLTFSLPIGQSYPLGGGLSYGLVLYGNANVWEPETDNACTPPGYTNPPEVPPVIAHAFRTANAGLGWILSLGRLTAPNDKVMYSGSWTYQAPDGSERIFSAELHAASAAPLGEVGYTRDSTYIRLRKAFHSETGTHDHDTLKYTDRVHLDFGDGSVHTFRRPPNDTGSWLLERISNRFSANWLEIAYYQNGLLAGNTGPVEIDEWRLTDNWGRTHYVRFAWKMYDRIRRPMVTSVELTAFGGATSTYTFTYTDQTLRRPVWHSPLENAVGNNKGCVSREAVVPMLTAITLPDSTQFQFSYHSGTGAGLDSGVMTKAVFPTGGFLTWSWSQYVKPVGTAPEAYLQYSWGVSKRQMWAKGSNPSAGAPIATREYQNSIDCNSDAPETCKEAKTVVVDEAGNKTEQYFWLMQSDEYGMSTASQYGQPFTPKTKDAAGQRYLSTRVLTSTNTPLRSTYVRYEADPWSNQRLQSKRVVFEDDKVGNTPVYIDTNLGYFDGLGHYRQAEVGGTATGGAKRITFTNYNPGRGTLNGIPAFTNLAVTDPWIIGTFDSRTTTEGDQTLETEYCFDPSTGFLKRTRTLKAFDGTQGAADLVAVFTPDGRGNVAREDYYGGDTAAAIGSGDLCTLGVSNPTYSLQHTLTSGTTGVTQRSQYLTPGGAMPFYVSDNTLDPSTHLLAKSTDVAGVSSDYVYDTMGRLTQAKPQGRAWTVYTYTAATAAQRAGVTVHQYANGSTSGTALTTGSTLFDDFGRPVVEFVLLPDQIAGSESRRETVYDALGRQHTVSELGTSTTLPVTTFEYDALGRVTKVTAPDASISKTTFIGDRFKERTSYVRIFQSGPDSEVKVSETYDGFGRLIKVAEKSGPTSASIPAGAEVTAEYRYDAGNRLTLVKMTGPQNAFQERMFDYDGRGFLRWESHPESGMTAYRYDARGHVKEKSHGAAFSMFDLQYEHDAAERLTAVKGRAPSGSSPAWRPIKEAAFASANDTSMSPADLRQGKLLTATRYNYPVDPVGHGHMKTFYKVTETYAYRDAAGRRTHRTTDIRKSETTTSPIWQQLKTVEQSFSYDDLDLIQQTNYPSCMDCGTSSEGPVRQQQLTYSQGRITAVPGIVSSIEYWPNGMWNKRTHTNDIEDVQTIDVSGMPRPQSISAAQKKSCTAVAIVAQPEGRKVTSPETQVTLSVTAGGTSPSYQWFRCTTDCDEIVGATASTYVVTAAEGVTYHVVVSNECSSLTSIDVEVSSQCLAPGAYIETEFPYKPLADGRMVLEANIWGTGPLTVTWRRTSDNAVVGTGPKITVGPLTATTAYSVTVEHTCSTNTDTAMVTVQVPLPVTATGLTAQKMSGSAIRVTWPASANAYKYVLERRSGTAGWEYLGETQTLQYDDGNLTVNTAYAYRMYALDSAGRSRSRYSNADVAFTGTFAFVQASSLVAATHMDEALRAVNAVRAAAGWPALSWSEIVSTAHALPVPQQMIRAAHFYTCRARMSEALQALGAVTPAYVDPDLTGKSMKKEHVNDILGAAQ